MGLGCFLGAVNKRYFGYGGPFPAKFPLLAKFCGRCAGHTLTLWIWGALYYIPRITLGFKLLFAKRGGDFQGPATYS